MGNASDHLSGALQFLRDDYSSDPSLFIHVISPVFAALFASLFGVWVGAKLAVETQRREQLRKSIGILLVASGTFAAICKRSLQLKSQRLVPMAAKYEKDRDYFVKSLESEVPKVFSVFEFHDMEPPRFPIAELERFACDSSEISPQMRAQVGSLAAACEGVLHYIEERRQLMEAYRNSSSDWDSERCSFWYFGVRMRNGTSDTRFRDNQNNLISSMDDVIFHSLQLHEQAVKKSLLLRRNIKKNVRNNYDVYIADFSKEKEKGLIPNTDAHKSWSNQPEKEKFGRWWWTNARYEREIATKVQSLLFEQ
ncbi:MAG: hypothetical protein ABJF50_23535 [Paracoccaceae bacterium]